MQLNTCKKYWQNCPLLPHWLATPAHSLSSRAAQKNLSQQRPADNPDALLKLATSLKEKLEGSQYTVPLPLGS